MSKLIFLSRSEKEVQVFGGKVFFDIDGKKAGSITDEDQVIELPSGKHTIKMYKTHADESLVGFTRETEIELAEDEELTVKYMNPLTTTQCGHMIISDKNQEHVYAMEQPAAVNHEEERKNHKNGLMLSTACAVIGTVIIAFWMF